LTASELSYIEQFLSSSLYTLSGVIGNVVSARARIGFEAVGHTAADVNLYSFGYSSDQLEGNYDNTQINEFVKNLFSFDLQAITNELSNFSPYPPASSKRDAMMNDDMHAHV
jgi:alkaline phosphatase